MKMEMKILTMNGFDEDVGWDDDFGDEDEDN
jgi:hypothetical protein